MKNAPDQLTDDSEYAKRFSEWGDKTEMATLTRVSNTNFGRQLDPTKERHPSDYHRGRRAAYAAGYLPDREKGEWIKAGLDEAYEAGVRDRVGAQSVEAVKFPARLAHEVIEVELSTADAASVPVEQRRRKIRKLIRELSAYEGQLASRSGTGSERDAREATTQRPRPVEAKAS